MPCCDLGHRGRRLYKLQAVDAAPRCHSPENPGLTYLVADIVPPPFVDLLLPQGDARDRMHTLQATVAIQARLF